MVAQVAAALAAAHARGLVHRDVKPANVLVTADDHCYLTDFGLVKDLAATTGVTRTGEVLGTLDYVAPERIQGGETGPWTDVYALGCVLFFALTGRVVFPLEEPERKLWAHLSEPPPLRSPAPSTRWWPARWPRTRASATRARRSWLPQCRAPRRAATDSRNGWSVFGPPRARSSSGWSRCARSSFPARPRSSTGSPTSSPNDAAPSRGSTPCSPSGDVDADRLDELEAGL